MSGRLLRSLAGAPPSRRRGWSRLPANANDPFHRLPFGLRLGAWTTLPRLLPLTAMSANDACDHLRFLPGSFGARLCRLHPLQSDTRRIIGHGVFINAFNCVDRYYLDDADAWIEVCNAGSAQATIRYFHKVQDIEPRGERSWEAWADDQVGYIGQSTFELADGTRYYRMWRRCNELNTGRTMTERVRDLVGHECAVQRRCMHYARPRYDDESVEHLFASAVVAPGQRWIELHIGLAVRPDLLTVIP